MPTCPTCGSPILDPRQTLAEVDGSTGEIVRAHRCADHLRLLLALSEAVDAADAQALAAAKHAQTEEADEQVASLATALAGVSTLEDIIG